MTGSRWIGAAVLATLTLAASTIAHGSTPATAGASANLLSNGTFEGSGSGSLSGWKATDGVLTLAPDGEGGGFAAKVAFSGTGATFTLRAKPRPVTATVAGTSYSADGSFRSDIAPAKKVCLKLTEYSSAGQHNLGTSVCTLAYWHEPYYNGTTNTASSYAYFWQTLYNAGADIVLNGHLHTYARFAPQNASGAVDNSSGIREFIVGTGGEGLFSLGGSHNVQYTSKTFGVLELTLHPTSYDWKFISTSGAMLDSGTTACH